MSEFAPWVGQQQKVERALNREQHSLYNCLLSILDDSRFVNEIRVLYSGLPVFVNLRCGLWYSAAGHETCYFKSTDGHFGNWSFSLVRLNLHVAQACSQRGGCVIVDATRRGKTFPVRRSHCYGHVHRFLSLSGV
jgi:tRNA A64-2'-O-ribosylphosphate transferase